MNHLATLPATQTPPLITAAGDRATYRFLEFFTAQIRNPHTRRAYVRAVSKFCAWLGAHGVPSIAAVGSIHVAAYVKDLGHRHSAPAVKQHLAAIRFSPGSERHGESAISEAAVQKLRDFCTTVCTMVSGWEPPRRPAFSHGAPGCSHTSELANRLQPV